MRSEGLSFYWSSVRLLSTKVPLRVSMIPMVLMLSVDLEASEKAEAPYLLITNEAPRHVTLQPSSNFLPSPANTLREMSLPSIAFGGFTARSQRDIRLSHGGVSEKRDCFRERSRRGRCNRLWVAGRYIGLWLIRQRNRMMKSKAIGSACRSQTIRRRCGGSVGDWSRATVCSPLRHLEPAKR